MSHVNGMDLTKAVGLLEELSTKTLKNKLIQAIGQFKVQVQKYFEI